MTSMTMRKENNINAKSYWEHFSSGLLMPFSAQYRSAVSLYRDKVK